MARLRTDSIPQQFAALKQEYYGGVSPARSDYAAAQPSRFRRNRTGLYGSGDSHYANEFQYIRVREYMRAMERDDAVIGMIVRRSVDNQVQGGAKVRPNTGDAGADKELKARMKAWSEDPDQCDVAGERSLQEFEWQIAHAEIVDGDIFLAMTPDGSLQAIESHRVRTPTRTRMNVVHGVLLDALRRPLQIWVCPDNLDPWQRFERVSDAVKIDVRDEQGFRQVFHCYQPDRVTQTRGVNAFHAVFDKCGMYEDTDFALLTKQQIAACLGAFLERTDQYSGDLQTGPRETQTNVDGTETIIEGISPGMVIRGKKGEKLSYLSPNVPSTEALEHMRRMLQVIGANVGMPLAMVLMDGKEGSFSSFRAVRDEAKLGFRVLQQRRKTRFYTPAYRWKVRQWIGEDPALRVIANRHDPNIDVYRHDVKFNGWPYIQPQHDALADATRMTNLLASPTMIHAEDGREYDDVLAESIRDNGAAIEAAIVEAKRISDKTKINVSWKDVLHRDEAKGTQLIDTLETADSVGGSSKPAPGASASGGGAGASGAGESADGGETSSAAAPIINVTVPARRRTRKTIRRDDRGLIVAVDEEQE